jgi:hypothetical protein
VVRIVRFWDYSFYIYLSLAYISDSVKVHLIRHYKFQRFIQPAIYAGRLFSEKQQNSNSTFPKFGTLEKLEIGKVKNEN